MPYSEGKIKLLEEKARQVRKLIIEMLSKAGSGHPGGSLSAADLITALYNGFMRHDPKNPSWPERDRFHLSKGHACPALYAVLAELGYFDKKLLWTLRTLGTRLQGHPDRRTPGVEVASGSLGQGLSVGLGMALASLMDDKRFRVYVLMGDGEMQEGNIWEAAMACAHYKLANLCAILDYNGYQIDGRVCDIMNIEPIADKWKSFGWNTIEIDGHNMLEILQAFDAAQRCHSQPTIIIARTIKGKGVSFMENIVDFHGRTPTPEETRKAIAELS